MTRIEQLAAAAVLAWQKRCLAKAGAGYVKFVEANSAFEVEMVELIRALADGQMGEASDPNYCPDGERHKWSVPVNGAPCVQPGCKAVKDTLVNNPEPPVSVLREADGLIFGPRRGSYGHPLDDFSRTGRMWGAILGLAEPVTAEQVGLCMVAVKISRECNAPKRDNRVDGAGYFGTVDMVVEERARRADK